MIADILLVWFVANLVMAQKIVSIGKIVQLMLIKTLFQVSYHTSWNHYFLYLPSKYYNTPPSFIVWFDHINRDSCGSMWRATNFWFVRYVNFRIYIWSSLKNLQKLWRWWLRWNQKFISYCRRMWDKMQ